MDPQPITIVITRRIRPEALEAFQQAVRAWVPRALQFPGHLGALIVQPSSHAQDVDTEHGIILRFQTQQDWESFRRWPPYAEFLATIAPMLKVEPRISELQGLEAWMHTGRDGQPIRWRMALVTFIAVNILVYASMRLVAAIGPAWPFWPAFILTNAIVVAALAWVVMPLATRALHAWLTATPRSGHP